MLEIEYTATATETAAATYDFLTNRPILQLLFLFMKLGCIIICITFMLCVYSKFIRPQDVAAFITAAVWLGYYKKFNNWLIKNALRKRKFADTTCMFKIDHKSICCQYQNAPAQHIEWKKLKYILQNKHGYIIPLTGIANAGRFLWLPMRSLEQAALQQEFLALVRKFNLPVKMAST